MGMRRFARTCSGDWYVAGDFNPAVAVPVLPFLEWVLFFVTGVSPEAARGLVVGFFFLNLLLSYLLLRAHGPRWAGLLAVTLMATNPFLYCFSRLAILEPLLTAFTLAAMNVAVRLPRMRRPMMASAGIGLLLDGDDADQDDGGVSAAGGGLGAGGGSAASAKKGDELRGGGAGCIRG